MEDFNTFRGRCSSYALHCRARRTPEHRRTPCPSDERWRSGGGLTEANAEVSIGRSSALEGRFVRFLRACSRAHSTVSTYFFPEARPEYRNFSLLSRGRTGFRRVDFPVFPNSTAKQTRVESSTRQSFVKALHLGETYRTPFAGSIPWPAWSPSEWR